MLFFQFDLSKYFNIIFPDDNVKSDEEMIVYAPNYIKKMVDLVKGTPRE